MKKIIFLALIGILLSGCIVPRPAGEAEGNIDEFIPPPISEAQANGAIIRFEPESLSLNVGDTATLDIFVEDVTNLFGVEIKAQFDPGLLQVQDADPNTDGVQITPGPFLSLDFMALNKTDNNTGLIQYVMSQTGSSQPKTGSGSLASITFQAIAAGESSLTFSVVKLANPESQPISATTQPGQVTVGAGGETATPTGTAEPGTETATPTATLTPTTYPGTATPTLSPTPTLEPGTATPTPTPTGTPTPTSTFTPAPPTATPTPPALAELPPGATTGFCYRVQLDETIHTLAQKFGVEAAQINLANDLSPAYYVYPQQVIFIPENMGRGPNYYIAKHGETLAQIADWCQLPVTFLAWSNDLKDELLDSDGRERTVTLEAGQAIKIPRPPFPPPSRYPHPPPGPPSTFP